MIDQFNNYDIIKSVIIDSKNKMRHHALNKSWYLKTNNLPIFGFPNKTMNLGFCLIASLFFTGNSILNFY